MCTTLTESDFKEARDVKLAGMLLKLLSGLYTLLLTVILLAAVGFSGYKLWDSYQMIESARDVQTVFRNHRPTTENKQKYGKKRYFTRVKYRFYIEKSEIPWHITICS